MRPGIYGLGWFIRRSPDHEHLTAFYHDVVGLPVIRRGNLTAFWAGETAVLEVSYGGERQPEYRDRADVPTIPVFRVLSLERVVDGLKARGVKFLNEPFEKPHALLAYFLDPSGNVTGIVERRRTSDRPEDIEAFRRWDRGRLSIPGVDPLPPHFQHLGWVILRCQDQQGIVEFYQDAIGLDFVHKTDRSTFLSFGDVERLEIATGSTPQPAPADRMQASNSFLLRVDNVDRQMDEMVKRGAAVVNEPFDIPGGRLGYLVDPEGHVFGLQQRNADTTRPEDKEAAARIERRQRSR